MGNIFALRYTVTYDACAVGLSCDRAFNQWEEEGTVLMPTKLLWYIQCSMKLFVTLCCARRSGQATNN